MILTTSVLLTRIELILQDIVYFLTKRLANRIAFLVLGALLARRNRYKLYSLSSSELQEV